MNALNKYSEIVRIIFKAVFEKYNNTEEYESSWHINKHILSVNEIHTQYYLNALELYSGVDTLTVNTNCISKLQFLGIC